MSIDKIEIIKKIEYIAKKKFDLLEKERYIRSKIWEIDKKLNSEQSEFRGTPFMGGEISWVKCNEYGLTIGVYYKSKKCVCCNQEKDCYLKVFEFDGGKYHEKN